MKRIRVVLVATAFVYASLLVLLWLGMSKEDAEPARIVWFVCAAVTLSNSAMELGLLPLWVWLKFTRRLEHDPYVKLTLTDADRSLLADRAPATAILIPAHKECTTAEDREDFVDRLFALICDTPVWSVVYLLFDSPREQQTYERWVIAAVRKRLRKAGRRSDARRLQYAEFRSKPRHMKNKPGSIFFWLNLFANKFEFFFVLDADSSLPPHDDPRPECREVLLRLVLAMLNETELSMVQASIRVRTFQTAWGWFQWVNSHMASRYHGPLFQWLLHGCGPSYGHNVLFRTKDFVKYVKNTLQYLSHDFLDAADLIAAKKLCIHTHRVITYELGENSLLGYVVREFRWARGNLQWVVFWLTKPKLPLGPRVFIGVGILFYVWPLLTSVLLIASLLLLREGSELISADGTPLGTLLISLVFISLLLPRAFASRSLVEFNLSAIVGLLISPALMVIRGVVFLISAYGSEWRPRGARSCEIDLDHIVKLGKWFYPVAALGMLLELYFLPDARHGGVDTLFLRFHIMMFIASPLWAYLLSLSLPKDRLSY